MNFLINRFVSWHMSHYITLFWTDLLMSGHYKCWKIIASVLSSPG